MKARLNTLPVSPGVLRNRKAAAWLALVVCATFGFVWLESNSTSHANASQTGLYSVPGQEAGRLAPNTTYTNTFAPLNIKPYGIPGVMNELNISVQGPDGFRTLGDAYQLSERARPLSSDMGISPPLPSSPFESPGIKSPKLI